MSIKIFGATALVSALAFGSFSMLVGQNAQAANESKTIDTFYYSLNDLYINQLSNSLQDKALSDNLKLKQYDANDDLILQISQIETAVSSNVDKTPIIVNPVDTQNGTAALLAAKENNVPIIFFNRTPDLHVLSSYKDAWFVGTDPNSAGRYQAQIVEDFVMNHKEVDRNKDGYISYLLLKGESGHQDTNARSGTFLRTILENDKIKVKPVNAIYADWSQAKAQEAVSEYINKNGLEDIELIVSNNDAMALGAITALQANQYNLTGKNADKSKFIPVVGIDAVPSALDAIEKGTMIGTVLNDADSMAAVIIKIADAYLEGKTVDDNLVGYKIVDNVISIPYVQITNQNVDFYTN